MSPQQGEPVFAALAATERADSIPAGDDIYGWLIGEWNFEWTDGKGTPNERRVNGEWLFTRILEGRAVQDVFICPSREARKTRSYPDAEYGTTIRTYLPEKRAWEAVYFRYDGSTRMMAEKRPNGDIVHTMTDLRGFEMRWVFGNIAKDTFHWYNEVSGDGGKTWRLVGELYAARRT